MRGPSMTRGYEYLDPNELSLERQPWYLELEPDAQVAAGATQMEQDTVSNRDFICLGMGMTAGPTLAFPAVASRWKIQVEDVGAQKVWQPRAFTMTAVIGGNFNVSDSSYVDLPVPWLFKEKTTIRVQFENIGAFPCLPTLVLVGYLTNWEHERAAASRRRKLELAALERQAGVSAPDPMRERYR